MEELNTLINEYNLLKNKEIINSKNIYNEKMKKDSNIHYNLKEWFYYAIVIAIIGLFVSVGQGYSDSFFIVFFIMLGVPFIIYLGYQKIKVNSIQREKIEATKNYENILKKYSFNSPTEYVTKNEKLMNKIINKYKEIKRKMGLTCEEDYWIFTSEGIKRIDFLLEGNELKIYLINIMLEYQFKEFYKEYETEFEYGYNFKLKNDILKKEDFKIKEYMNIDLSNILYFTKIGKVEHLSKVSGGGGKIGGTDWGGALLGGIIAGTAGAIIGSRQEGKIDSIKTETTEIDTRQTLLKLKDKEILFNLRTYDVLLGLIPDKDYDTQIINKNDNNLEIKDNTDIIEKIEKLKSLLDTGALTNEEFENQKKKILLMT